MKSGPCEFSSPRKEAGRREEWAPICPQEFDAIPRRPYPFLARSRAFEGFGMRRSRGFAWPTAALALEALATSTGHAAPPSGIIHVKPGQEVTFAAAIVDGRVALGPGRVAKLGTAEPKEGEITVGVAPKVQPFYAEVRVREKTAAPIDFVATGLIGGTKIDEIVLCGNIDAPVAARIANAAWTISLNSFEPRKGDESCP